MGEVFHRLPFMTMQWATNLIPFRGCPDRFSPGGYRPALNTLEAIRGASKAYHLRGVELHYPDMFDGPGVEGVWAVLQETGLACAIVSPTVSGQQFQRGALTNPDRKIRLEAQDRVRRSMDVAERLGAGRINLWLGQDGYSYPFETDYRALWDRLIEGVAACADHNPRVGICIEYKPKEPRARLAVGNVGRLLYLLREVNRPNVGGLLDLGHALMAGENLAEAATLLARADKLFHIHFNDTYGDWDWDLVAGSVHTVEFLEVLFWLQNIGYKGWYSLDLFPQREDPVEACSRSIRIMESLARMAARLDRQRLTQLVESRDALGVLELLSQILGWEDA